jgi:hypothetical protein
LTILSEDEDAVDPVVTEWTELIISAIESTQREPSPGPKLESWVAAAGFQKVSQRQFKVPIGSWSEEPGLQEIGSLYLAQTVSGLDAFSLRLMCDMLGWRLEDVRKLLARVRRAFLSQEHRLYMNL